MEKNGNEECLGLVRGEPMSRSLASSQSLARCRWLVAPRHRAGPRAPGRAGRAGRKGVSHLEAAPGIRPAYAPAAARRRTRRLTLHTLRPAPSRDRDRPASPTSHLPSATIPPVHACMHLRIAAHIAEPSHASHTELERERERERAYIALLCPSQSHAHSLPRSLHSLPSYLDRLISSSSSRAVRSAVTPTYFCRLRFVAGSVKQSPPSLQHIASQRNMFLLFALDSVRVGAFGRATRDLQGLQHAASMARCTSRVCHSGQCALLKHWHPDVRTTL